MNQPNPSPPPQSPTPKVLRRPVHGRKLAGVAQALADYLVIDATIVRILFVVCGFLGGSGVILYLAGAILIPSEDGTGATFTTIDNLKRDRSAATIVGLIVAAVGSIVLLGELGDSNLIAPLLLVAVGVALLLWKSDPAEVAASTPTGPVANATTGYTPPPTPAASAGMSAFGTAQQEAPIYPGDQSAQIPPAPQVGSEGDIPWVPPRAQAPTPSEPKKKRPKSKLTWVALAGLFVYFGTAIVMNESGVNLDADRTIAWGLAAVGGVLAYSAFFGRARFLIFVGLLMIPVMFATGEASFDDGLNIDFETSRIEIGAGDGFTLQNTDFDTGVGSVEYDLRFLELDGGTETLNIDHGVGEVLIRVPSDVELDIQADAGAGDIDVLGRRADGPGASVSYGSGSGSSEGKLIISIDIGLGKIEVTK